MRDSGRVVTVDLSRELKDTDSFLVLMASLARHRQQVGAANSPKYTPEHLSAQVMSELRKLVAGQEERLLGLLQGVERDRNWPILAFDGEATLPQDGTMFKFQVGDVGTTRMITLVRNMMKCVRSMVNDSHSSVYKPLSSETVEKDIANLKAIEKTHKAIGKMDATGQPVFAQAFMHVEMSRSLEELLSIFAEDAVSTFAEYEGARKVDTRWPMPARSRFEAFFLRVFLDMCRRLLRVSDDQSDAQRLEDIVQSRMNKVRRDHPNKNFGFGLLEQKLGKVAETDGCVDALLEALPVLAMQTPSMEAATVATERKSDPNGHPSALESDITHTLREKLYCTTTDELIDAKAKFERRSNFDIFLANITYRASQFSTEYHPSMLSATGTDKQAIFENVMTASILADLLSNDRCFRALVLVGDKFANRVREQSADAPRGAKHQPCSRGFTTCAPAPMEVAALMLQVCLTSRGMVVERVLGREGGSGRLAEFDVLLTNYSEECGVDQAKTTPVPMRRLRLTLTPGTDSSVNKLGHPPSWIHSFTPDYELPVYRVKAEHVDSTLQKVAAVPDQPGWLYVVSGRQAKKYQQHRIRYSRSVTFSLLVDARDWPLNCFGMYVTNVPEMLRMFLQAVDFFYVSRALHALFRTILVALSPLFFSPCNMDERVLDETFPPYKQARLFSSLALMPLKAKAGTATHAMRSRDGADPVLGAQLDARSWYRTEAGLSRQHNHGIISLVGARGEALLGNVKGVSSREEQPPDLELIARNAEERQGQPPDDDELPPVEEEMPEDDPPPLDPRSGHPEIWDRVSVDQDGGLRRVDDGLSTQSLDVKVGNSPLDGTSLEEPPGLSNCAESHGPLSMASGTADIASTTGLWPSTTGRAPAGDADAGKGTWHMSGVSELTSEVDSYSHTHEDADSVGNASSAGKSWVRVTTRPGMSGGSDVWSPDPSIFAGSRQSTSSSPLVPGTIQSWYRTSHGNQPEMFDLATVSGTEDMASQSDTISVSSWIAGMLDNDEETPHLGMMTEPRTTVSRASETIGPPREPSTVLLTSPRKSENGGSIRTGSDTSDEFDTEIVKSHTERVIPSKPKRIQNASLRMTSDPGSMPTDSSQLPQSCGPDPTLMEAEANRQASISADGGPSKRLGDQPNEGGSESKQMQPSAPMNSSDRAGGDPPHATTGASELPSESTAHRSGGDDSAVRTTEDANEWILGRSRLLDPHLILFVQCYKGWLMTKDVPRVNLEGRQRTTQIVTDNDGSVLPIKGWMTTPEDQDEEIALALTLGHDADWLPIEQGCCTREEFDFIERRTQMEAAYPVRLTAIEKFTKTVSRWDREYLLTGAKPRWGVPLLSTFEDDPGALDQVPEDRKERMGDVRKPFSEPLNGRRREEALAALMVRLGWGSMDVMLERAREIERCRPPAWFGVTNLAKTTYFYAVPISFLMDPEPRTIVERTHATLWSNTSPAYLRREVTVVDTEHTMWTHFVDEQSTALDPYLVEESMDLLVEMMSRMSMAGFQRPVGTRVTIGTVAEEDEPATDEFTDAHSAASGVTGAGVGWATPARTTAPRGAQRAREWRSLRDLATQLAPTAPADRPAPQAPLEVYDDTRSEANQSVSASTLNNFMTAVDEDPGLMRRLIESAGQHERVTVPDAGDEHAAQMTSINDFLTKDELARSRALVECEETTLVPATCQVCWKTSKVSDSKRAVATCGDPNCASYMASLKHTIRAQSTIEFYAHHVPSSDEQELMRCDREWKRMEANNFGTDANGNRTRWTCMTQLTLLEQGCRETLNMEEQWTCGHLMGVYVNKETFRRIHRYARLGQANVGGCMVRGMSVMVEKGGVGQHSPRQEIVVTSGESVDDCFWDSPLDLRRLQKFFPLEQDIKMAPMPWRQGSLFVSCEWMSRVAIEAYTKQGHSGVRTVMHPTPPTRSLYDDVQLDVRESQQSNGTRDRHSLARRLVEDSSLEDDESIHNERVRRLVNASFGGEAYLGYMPADQWCMEDMMVLSKAMHAVMAVLPSLEVKQVFSEWGCALIDMHPDQYYRLLPHAALHDDLWGSLTRVGHLEQVFRCRRHVRQARNLILEAKGAVHDVGGDGLLDYLHENVPLLGQVTPIGGDVSRQERMFAANMEKAHSSWQWIRNLMLLLVPNDVKLHTGLVPDPLVRLRYLILVYRGIPGDVIVDRLRNVHLMLERKEIKLKDLQRMCSTCVYTDEDGSTQLWEMFRNILAPHAGHKPAIEFPGAYKMDVSLISEAPTLPVWSETMARRWENTMSHALSERDVHAAFVMMRAFQDEMYPRYMGRVAKHADRWRSQYQSIYEPESGSVSDVQVTVTQFSVAVRGRHRTHGDDYAQAHWSGCDYLSLTLIPDRARLDEVVRNPGSAPRFEAPRFESAASTSGRSTEPAATPWLAPKPKAKAAAKQAPKETMNPRATWAEIRQKVAGKEHTTTEAPATAVMWEGQMVKPDLLAENVRAYQVIQMVTALESQCFVVLDYITCKRIKEGVGALCQAMLDFHLTRDPENIYGLEVCFLRDDIPIRYVSMKVDDQHSEVRCLLHKDLWSPQEKRWMLCWYMRHLRRVGFGPATVDSCGRCWAAAEQLEHLMDHVSKPFDGSQGHWMVQSGGDTGPSVATPCALWTHGTILPTEEPMMKEHLPTPTKIHNASKLGEAKNVNCFHYNEFSQQNKKNRDAVALRKRELWNLLGGVRDVYYGGATKELSTLIAWPSLLTLERCRYQPGPGMPSKGRQSLWPGLEPGAFTMQGVVTPLDWADGESITKIYSATSDPMSDRAFLRALHEDTQRYLARQQTFVVWQEMFPMTLVSARGVSPQTMGREHTLVNRTSYDCLRGTVSPLEGEWGVLQSEGSLRMVEDSDRLEPRRGSSSANSVGGADYICQTTSTRPIAVVCMFCANRSKRSMVPGQTAFNGACLLASAIEMGPEMLKLVDPKTIMAHFMQSPHLAASLRRNYALGIVNWGPNIMLRMRAAVVSRMGAAVWIDFIKSCLLERRRYLGGSLTPGGQDPLESLENLTAMLRDPGSGSPVKKASLDVVGIVHPFSKRLLQHLRVFYRYEDPMTAWVSVLGDEPMEMMDTVELIVLAHFVKAMVAPKAMTPIQLLLMEATSGVTSKVVEAWLPRKTMSHVERRRNPAHLTFKDCLDFEMCTECLEPALRRGVVNTYMCLPCTMNAIPPTTDGRYPARISKTWFEEHGPTTVKPETVQERDRLVGDQARVEQTARMIKHLFGKAFGYFEHFIAHDLELPTSVNKSIPFHLSPESQKTGKTNGVDDAYIEYRISRAERCGAVVSSQVFLSNDSGLRATKDMDSHVRSAFNSDRIVAAAQHEPRRDGRSLFSVHRNSFAYALSETRLPAPPVWS